MTTLDTMAQVACALSRFRFGWATEADLQAGVALALEASEMQATREVRLGPAGRCDFFVPTEDDRGVVVELKIQGSPADVLRQLHRYACVARVDGVVLVSTSLRLRAPEQLAGKPVRVVHLQRFA